MKFIPATFALLICSAMGQQSPSPAAIHGATNSLKYDATATDVSHMSISVSRDQLPQKALEAAEQEIDDSANEIKSLETDLDQARSPERKRSQLQAELVEDLKGTGAEVYRNEELVVVRVKESEFKSGSRKETQAMKKALVPIAKATMKHAADYDLMIEGHTDAIPVRDTAKYGDNWQMGFARASEVAAALRSMLLRDDGIAIASRGSNLSISNDKDAAENRRVEFVFMPKRSSRDTSLTGGALDGVAAIAAATPDPTPAATPSLSPSPTSTPAQGISGAVAKVTSSPAPSKKGHAVAAATPKPEIKSLDQEGDLLFEGKKANN